MLVNWAKATTSTAGTGDLTLVAVSGFPEFGDVFSIGQIVGYSVLNSNGEPAEEGIGCYSAVNTLTRTAVCATYTGGVYDNTAPTAVSLSGAYTVIASSVRGMAPTLPQINTAAAARYYSTPSHQLSTNTRTVVAGDLVAVPFLYTAARPVDAFALEITTLGAGAVARAGLYAVGANGLPAKRLIESADIDCSTTGVKVATFGAVSIPPGWYYTLFACKTANVGVRAYSGGGAGSLFMTNMLGQDAFNAPYTYTRISGWNTGWTSLPEDAPAGTWSYIKASSEYAPHVAMRLVS